MAFTIFAYNHTTRLLHSNAITVASLKVELLETGASFNPAHTTRNQVNNSGAWAFDGNGWDVGGEPLTGAAITTVDTDGIMLDANDIIVNAAGGAIGPAIAALIYDDAHASDAPLFYIDFGGSETAGIGTDFKILWNANGIYRGTIA